MPPQRQPLPLKAHAPDFFVVSLNDLPMNESKTVAIFHSPEYTEPFMAISGQQENKLPDRLVDYLIHEFEGKTHRMDWNCAEMNCIKDILQASGQVTNHTPQGKIRKILEHFQFTTMNIKKTPDGFLKRYIDPCGKYEKDKIGCYQVLNKLNLSPALEWDPRVR